MNTTNQRRHAMKKTGTISAIGLAIATAFWSSFESMPTRNRGRAVNRFRHLTKKGPGRIGQSPAMLKVDDVKRYPPNDQHFVRRVRGFSTKWSSAWSIESRPRFEVRNKRKLLGTRG